MTGVALFAALVSANFASCSKNDDGENSSNQPNNEKNG